MIRKRVAILLAPLLCSIALAQAPRPKNGYVPDEDTAIKIAKAILEPMIGRQGVKMREPFRANLHNSVWEILGKTNLPPSIRGGGGIDMRINKQTGEILGYHFSR